MVQPYKIGMVAGESSGDQLGAGLICALKIYYPDAVFEGIGGSKMTKEGFVSLFPIDRLSVMGFIEPLKRLPELFRIRKNLFQHFCDGEFDLVVGIDSPDFNLGLEEKLRNKGIKTAHYVSPSVWAWRQGRVKKIARAVDLMITLFPFEKSFYQLHSIPVVCVGHPLAAEIAVQEEKNKARQVLGLTDGPVLTLMPGSRASEIQKLGSLFLNVAQHCKNNLPDLKVIIPIATLERKSQLDQILDDHPLLEVILLDGQSLLAMAAADVVLLSSGTSTLEAMLLKKPMVVAYRLGRLTYALISRMVKVKYVALPNLLANESLVPEFLEENATIKNLSGAVMRFFEQPEQTKKLQKRFIAIHESLKCGGNEAAAQALVALIDAS